MPRRRSRALSADSVPTNTAIFPPLGSSLIISLPSILPAVASGLPRSQPMSHAPQITRAIVSLNIVFIKFAPLISQRRFTRRLKPPLLHVELVYGHLRIRLPRLQNRRREIRVID